MSLQQINGNEFDLEKIESNIDGLSYIPQIKSINNFRPFINDADEFPIIKRCSAEVSSGDYDLVKLISKSHMTDGIFEIGVSRNGEGSFTRALLSNKPDNVPYLGIDIEDKSFLNDESKKIFTIKENSFNQSVIRNYAKEVGIEKISILFIDGWHSVNAVINDFKYSDLLSDNGIIIFHDTNFHPGPTIVVEAIDKTKYKVQKFFEDDTDDYGVTIAYKL